MLSPGELKVLRKIRELHVVKKNELHKMMEPDSPAVVDALVKSLLEKEYVTTVAPVGMKCFIITKSGIQEVSHRE